MSIKLDKHYAFRDFFSSFEEFFKYFRDTRVLMREDEKKHRLKGEPSIVEILPTTMEVKYTKSLKHPQLVFPKFSHKVILELPEEPSPQKADKKSDLFFFASVVKLIEMDLTAQFAVIAKQFHSKTEAEKKGE